MRAFQILMRIRAALPSVRCPQIHREYKERPGVRDRGFQGEVIRISRDQGALDGPDTIPRHKSGKARSRKRPDSPRIDSRTESAHVWGGRAPTRAPPIPPSLAPSPDRPYGSGLTLKESPAKAGLSLPWDTSCGDRHDTHLS